MLSVKDNFEIDNTILKSVESTFNNYFSNIKGFYADRLYFDKMYKDEGENILNGTFNIWLSDDATCCPSIEAKFKAFLSSTSNGYIEIEGIIVTNNETETKEKFEKRLVITK